MSEGPGARASEKRAAAPYWRKPIGAGQNKAQSINGRSAFRVKDACQGYVYIMTILFIDDEFLSFSYGASIFQFIPLNEVFDRNIVF